MTEMKWRGRQLLVGIDVGSTTTKAVAVEKESLKILGLNRKIEENKKKKGERIKIKSLSEEEEKFDFDLIRQVIKAPKVSIKVDINNMIDSNDMFEKIKLNYEKYK